MKVGILGATGAVGQKFIRLLSNHPWFEVTALGASERSAGKLYREAANWIEDIPLPESAADMTVRVCSPEAFADVDVVFSGLDSSVAFDIEGAFARAGIPVISNARNYRMDSSVPLLVPEVNPEHAALIRSQTFTGDGKGWVVTNPNCVAGPLAASLKPLNDTFGIENLIITTMQAVSGAGYPGVPSLDILGNMVPYISGEEPKVAPETHKILAALNGDGTLSQPDFRVQATCTRVPVLNGHMISVTAELKNKPGDIREVKEAFLEFNRKNPISKYNLPSAPETFISLHEDIRYPQPRLHAYQAGGMQVHVGRLRKAEVFDISYIAMAHNTIRGAAGGAILNAELLAEKGFLRR